MGGLVLIAAGCPAPGEGDGADASTTPTSSTSSARPTDGGPGPGEGDGSGDAAEGSSGIGSGPGASGTDSGTEARVPGDCRALLQAKPESPDGIYMLNVGGDPQGPTFEAYCDMTIDGGGWTLVGRSAAGEWDELPFGWQQATGSLRDDASPYSIDAFSAQLEFSEVLMGSYTEGKTWGEDVYRVEAPEHFVFVYERAPVAISTTPVKGTCSPEEGPHHMRYMGWTAASGYFYVGQYSSLKFDGLEADGWDTYHDDCDGGGNIHAGPGMIMVR